MAISICIPTNSARAFPLSTPSPAFIVCRLFDDGHSDWYGVISHCTFDLYNYLISYELTLYAREQKRNRCKEQTFGLSGERPRWNDLRE